MNKIYTMEKNTMKAVKSILKASEKKNAASRDWMRFAYLYSKGLILTDGTRLLRVHDDGLEEEFHDFITETDGVVILKLEGDYLTVYGDVDKNGSYVGTMERLISTDESFDKYGDYFVERFHTGTKEATVKELSASMLNTAIVKTGRWFTPEFFDGMGIRPWCKVLANESKISFSGNNGEAFICMGMAPEAD